MADKSNKLLIGKIFGILSIVFAFLSTVGIGGIVLGIIGLVQLKGEKEEVVKKLRTLNILGIVFGGIIFVFNIIYEIVMVSMGGLGALP